MLILESAMIFALSQKNGLGIFYRNDANEFRVIVKNIIDHGVFSLETVAPFLPTNFRTPGYPFFLLTIYLIFSSFKPAIFIGAAIFALSAPLVYLIGREIFPEKIALVSAVLFAVEPWALFQSGFLVAEQIFFPTFLFSLYLFYRYLKTGAIDYIFFASLFLGLTTLIRPLTIFFILIFIVFVFIFDYKHSFGRAFKMVFLLLFIFIAVLSPWLIRNKIALNTWQISSISSVNLYIENYAMLQQYLGKWGANDDPNETARIFLGTSNYEEAKRPANAAILGKAAVEGIKENLGSYIVMHLTKLPLFLVRNSYGNIFFDLRADDSNIQSKLAGFLYEKNLFGALNLIKNSSIGAKILIFLLLFWPIIIFFAIFGFVAEFKNYYKKSTFWFLILWIGYFLAITGNLRDISRYKLSINAPLFMFAILGFYKIYNYFKVHDN